jgi:hypothetical protein
MDQGFFTLRICSSGHRDRLTRRIFLQRDAGVRVDARMIRRMRNFFHRARSNRRAETKSRSKCANQCAVIRPWRVSHDPPRGHCGGPSDASRRRFVHCAIRSDTDQVRRRMPGAIAAPVACARRDGWTRMATIEHPEESMGVTAGGSCGVGCREIRLTRGAAGVTKVKELNWHRSGKSSVPPAAARSSPTNRIREDLQHLRRRVLLHPRHRHLHQDRRLGPRRICAR